MNFSEEVQLFSVQIGLLILSFFLQISLLILLRWGIWLREHTRGEGEGVKHQEDPLRSPLPPLKFMKPPYELFSPWDLDLCSSMPMMSWINSRAFSSACNCVSRRGFIWPLRNLKHSINIWISALKDFLEKLLHLFQILCQVFLYVLFQWI